MSFTCPHCGTLDINLETPITNIAYYGDPAHVAAPCCKRPLRLTTRTIVMLDVFNPSSDTDDWGEPYRKEIKNGSEKL